MRSNEYWMNEALRLAQKAESKDEVPVGALIVKNDEIISQAYNLRESLNTPLGHAELIAIHRASQKLQSWRLLGCTLYVTLEPCLMCAGTLIQSRVPRVVFGASDPKGGAVKSLYQVGQDTRLNHRFEIVSGVLENECAKLLKDFFQKKRREK